MMLWLRWAKFVELEDGRKIYISPTVKIVGSEFSILEDFL